MKKLEYTEIAGCSSTFVVVLPFKNCCKYRIVLKKIIFQTLWKFRIPWPNYMFFRGESLKSFESQNLKWYFFFLILPIDSLTHYLREADYPSIIGRRPEALLMTVNFWSEKSPYFGKRKAWKIIPLPFHTRIYGFAKQKALHLFDVNMLMLAINCGWYYYCSKIRFCFLQCTW